MPSVSSNLFRRAPQQERSERRLESFLDVAADLIAKVGFDAATMTEIAERSGTSIGGLYHYFPDKNSIAVALLLRYRFEIETEWAPIWEQAAQMTHKQFAHVLLERLIQVFEDRPAYLALLAARLRLPKDPAARKSLRSLFANSLKAKNANLSDEQAMLAANVAMGVVKGLIQVYADASTKEKPAIALEFKEILAFYLKRVLSGRETESDLNDSGAYQHHLSKTR